MTEDNNLAVVLAGGKSKRFGSNKSEIVLKDKKLIDLGTALYKPKKEIYTGEMGNYHASPDSTAQNFELIKKVPFLPNSLLVFPRTNYSFHGVDKINEDQSERNLIQLNYYFKTKE